MAQPKDPPSTAEKLRQRVEWEILKRGVEQAADTALDNLEQALFGKEGATPEVSGDALQRVREHWQVPAAAASPSTDPLEQTRNQLAALKEQLRGDSAAPAPQPESPPAAAAPKNDPLALARAQLEALKKARAEGTPPAKKTL